MGRPPSRRQQPSLPAFDCLRKPGFLRGVSQSLAHKERADLDAIEAAVARVEDDPKLANRRGVYPEGERDDPLRHMVYECKATDPVKSESLSHVAKTRGQDHVTIQTIAKTADCPLSYLHSRGEKRNRISDIQYAAGVRYREDFMALGRVGSNTAATIDHIMTAPTLTPEEKYRKAHDISLNHTMSCHDDTTIMKDPSDAILNAVYRLKRVDNHLEVWERTVLREIVVKERTIGMIATEWGQASEAVSVLVRMALWKLARTLESVDRDFRDWLVVERQINGEGRV